MNALLTVLLLGIPEPPPFALAEVLREGALGLEILDSREVPYFLERADSFADDWKLLQKRYRDLRYAPHLLDCARLPSYEVCGEVLAFNRQYRKYLEARQGLDLAHWWNYQEAISETDQLYQVWDAVREAQCEYYYVSVKRHALERLRGLLPESDYQEGTLPPFVPVWRFTLP